jgi:hypothetical protein
MLPLMQTIFSTQISHFPNTIQATWANLLSPMHNKTSITSLAMWNKGLP